MTSDAKVVSQEYQEFTDALVERDLLIDQNDLEVKSFSLKDERGKNRFHTSLSWYGSSGLSYLFSDYASIEQYQEVIKRRDYNFCLSDGSIIQINYKFDDEGILTHRLCFTPCPYPYNVEDLGDIGLADIPDMMSSGELISQARLVSPLRFDYDRKFSDEKHSFSHFTINSMTCRIPAYGPVSLGHFMRFVFRYFYEDEFSVSGWWPEVQPRLISRTLEYPRPHEFYIESSVGF